MLAISDRWMVRHYHSLLRQARGELDSLYQIINDSTILNRDTHEESRISILRDTVTGYIDVHDTLFRISEYNVLRSFKGLYFLNKDYFGSWEVQMMKVDNRHLTLSEIPSIEGMDKLKKISSVAVDSASGEVTLSNEDFREFVRKGGFYNTAEFVRIR